MDNGKIGKRKNNTWGGNGMMGGARKRILFGIEIIFVGKAKKDLGK